MGTRNDSLIIHFELGNEALNGAGVAAVIQAISVNFWPVLYDAMTAATSSRDMERRNMCFFSLNDSQLYKRLGPRPFCGVSAACKSQHAISSAAV